MVFLIYEFADTEDYMENLMRRKKYANLFRIN